MSNIFPPKGLASCSPPDCQKNFFLVSILIMWRHGNLNFGALNPRESSLGSSPDQGHCVTSVLGQDTTLAVLLATQVNKWVPVNSTLRVTLP